LKIKAKIKAKIKGKIKVKIKVKIKAKIEDEDRRGRLKMMQEAIRRR
jgi:hypothetical protein